MHLRWCLRVFWFEIEGGYEKDGRRRNIYNEIYFVRGERGEENETSPNYIFCVFFN